MLLTFFFEKFFEGSFNILCIFLGRFKVIQALENIQSLLFLKEYYFSFYFSCFGG